jgi:iron(III) transport system permease protein
MSRFGTAWSRERPVAVGAVAGGLCMLLAALAAVSWWMRGDMRTAGLLLTTCQLSAWVCVISLPLGTLPALLLFRSDMPARRGALWLLVALLLVPLYLQMAGWDAGFGKQGWYSLWTQSLAQPPLSGLRGAVWVHAMASIPWVVLIVGVGLRYVEPDLEEQVLLDGGTWGLVRWVLGPRILVSLAVAGLWVLLSTSAEMTVADMYLVPTYSRELYSGFALGDGVGEVARHILPGMTLVLALVSAALVVAGSFAPPAVETNPRPPRTIRLGSLRWPALMLMLVLLLLLAGLPLGNLVYKAGMVVREVQGLRIREWSAAAMGRQLVLSLPRFAKEHAWTLAIGSATAVSSVLVAAPLAWWARRASWRSLPALLVTALGLAVPAPLVALGIIYLLDRPESGVLVWLYDDTLFAPVAAMTVRALPWTLLVIWYAVRSIPEDVLDAALVDGAGRAGRFLRVVVPQRGATWALAGLLAFVVASGDLAASILVIPPGVTTLSVRVFGLIHAGVDDQVASLCLTASLGYAAVAALMVWLVSRATRLDRGL